MTIPAGTNKTFILSPGQVLALTCPAGSTGLVQRLADSPGGAGQGATAINGANQQYGPYANAASFFVEVYIGVVTDTVGMFNPGVGVTGGVDAPAGGVEEYQSAAVAVGAAVTLATGTAKTVASLLLSAGDWDVQGALDFIPAGTTSLTQLTAGLNTTADTLSATQDTASQDSFAAQVPGANNIVKLTPQVRFLIATPTTIYLVGRAVFSVAGLTAFGSLRARRAR